MTVLARVIFSNNFGMLSPIYFFGSIIKNWKNELINILWIIHSFLHLFSV